MAKCQTCGRDADAEVAELKHHRDVLRTALTRAIDLLKGVISAVRPFIDQYDAAFTKHRNG